ANKEKKIAVLSKENTDQKLVISKRNTAIISIVALVMIIGILSLLFYNRHVSRQEARLQAEIMKQQEIAVKGIIEAEEKERNRIAGDLHDGLGQLFSTVKMNLSGIADQLSFKDTKALYNFNNTLKLVDESCREVRSISHQMAPNVLLRAGLVSAIRDFVLKVDERLLKINLEVDGLSERLELHIETVLFRIIQESVNNAIKHAKANLLDIQLIKDEDGLSIMIEDNGEGFDGSKLNEFEGMGLKNMRTRVEYLKGKIDVDSALGRGTLVSIWLPITYHKLA
ncbi:sensor histidine kinase, partial [Pedobacter glucosidilyticus]|uniref:sensor histidine kinase n=1 Tax=Pedobacter glucosidilyticus TaxID=1122941 RepID=UPI0026EA18A7